MLAFAAAPGLLLTAQAGSTAARPLLCCCYQFTSSGRCQAAAQAPAAAICYPGRCHNAGQPSSIASARCRILPSPYRPAGCNSSAAAAAAVLHYQLSWLAVLFSRRQLPPFAAAAAGAACCCCVSRFLHSFKQLLLLPDICRQFIIFYLFGRGRPCHWLLPGCAHIFFAPGQLFFCPRRLCSCLLLLLSICRPTSCPSPSYPAALPLFYASIFFQLLYCTSNQLLFRVAPSLPSAFRPPAPSIFHSAGAAPATAA